MTHSTLTPTQQAILEHAVQNTGGRIIWFPENLKGGACAKVLQALYKRSLISPNGSNWVVDAEGYAELGLTQPGPATEIAPEPVSEPADTASVTTPTAPRTRANSKQALVMGLLQRPEGDTIAQIMEATGWQSHTVRGTFAGAFKKKLGLTLVSEKTQGGERVYRLA